MRASDPALATLLVFCKGGVRGVLEMRQIGTVKFYNDQKGYGFITPDDGGKDVFVHVTAIENSGIGHLSEGTRLSFDTEPDKRGKGPKAVNLQQAN
jgi:CspA family cold shock protein